MKAPLVAAIAGLMIGHCRADVLFSNGTLVTHAGAGYHGADVCQDIAIGIGGFNSAPSGAGRTSGSGTTSWWPAADGASAP